MEKEIMQILTQEELASLGEPKVKVTSKPTSTLYICIVLGILMIVTKRFWVLGILVLPVSILALIKIPEERRVYLYETFLVMFQNIGQEIILKVDYDDIQEWYIKQGSTTGDFLQLRLSNDQLTQVECFNSGKITKYLNDIMPDKEANKKKVDAINPTPIKFQWPWGKK